MQINVAIVRHICPILNKFMFINSATKHNKRSFNNYTYTIRHLKKTTRTLLMKWCMQLFTRRKRRHSKKCFVRVRYFFTEGPGRTEVLGF